MQTKSTDQYFLESASNVSFFFEEDAFAEDGSLRQAKALSINKIGHGNSLSCKKMLFLKSLQVGSGGIAGIKWQNPEVGISQWPCRE